MIRPRVVSAQMFLNEFDILEVKLNELNGIVDLHIIVESPITHSGISKPMHFSENRDRFRGWPIMYVAAEINTQFPCPVCRDMALRDTVEEELVKLNPEFVIHCDCDEVPRADKVTEFIASGQDVAALHMDNVWYYFDRVHPTDTCMASRICRWHGALPCRNIQGFPIVPDAGWHFEFFGTQEQKLEKVNATSHAPQDGSRGTWRAIRSGLTPPLAPYPFDKLPKYVRDNRSKYSHYFKGQ